MVSSASVTAIGIMSASVVLVTAGKDSYFIRWYKSCGAQGNFIVYYLFTMGCLLGTHTMSLFAMGSRTAFLFMFSAILTNTIQVFFIVFTAHLLVEKNENHPG